MYKYEMIIDDEPYNALFLDHFEAGDFLEGCAFDGQKVIVKGYHEVTPDDIIIDDDFETSYKVEMISEMLLPNARDFKKWSRQEAELKRLGITV